MLWFSVRNKIVKMFEEWCIKTNADMSLVNLISFLEIKGLLNEQKCMALLYDKEDDKPTE